MKIHVCNTCHKIKNFGKNTASIKNTVIKTVPSQKF